MFRTVNKVKCLNERSCYVLADVIIFVYEVPCIFWRYTNVDEVSLITLKTLFQSAMDSCYKFRQLFYYKVRHGLLQIETGITKCNWCITNCDRYYKVRWLLQIAAVRDFTLADIFQIKVSSVDLFYIFIYLCDFAKRCSLSFRVLLDVSREPRPEPIRGWVDSLFCVKTGEGREGRFCHFD